MLKLDIGAETCLCPLSVTMSEFNANCKVPTVFSKIVKLRCSWKSTLNTFKCEKTEGHAAVYSSKVVSVY